MRFVFFLVFLLASQSAWAQCACTPAPFDSRFESAGAIFAGKVKSITIMEKYVEAGNADLPAEVVFDVSEIFKGIEKGKPFLLKTSLTKNTCTGHPFEEGKEYLVFAYARKAETFEHWSLYQFPSGTYDVGGLCGGTQALDSEQAKADIVQARFKREIIAEEP